MGAINVVIEEMRPEDWGRVRAIYLEGIATGDATLETDAPAWEAWDASHLKSCRLVARAGGEIVGWAALSPVSSRCVYGGVGEVSVYVAESARGKGVGRGLLAALVEESERSGLWTLQAGVLAENAASIRLHERCGFRVVGTRQRLGKLKGVWRDVVLLERRSEMVGKD
ncbi:MAG: N-acetyltransferase family protein [Pyrinomonadaceae bacterium]